MMEVMEEEELAELRAHQEDFVQLRNAELAETQRMEEAERRKFEEKERRLAEVCVLDCFTGGVSSLFSTCC